MSISLIDFLQQLTRSVPLLITVILTIGVILVNGCFADYDSLFQQADSALYAAKKQGKNRHVIRAYVRS